MRKPILYLGSAVIAVFLCTFVLKTGIVDFAERPPKEGSKATTKEKPDSAKHKDAAIPENESSEERSAENPIHQQKDQKGLLSQLIDEDRDILERTRKYLRSLEGKPESEIESRFQAFLRDHLNLHGRKGAVLTRMCFWKGFVTLQKVRDFKDREHMEIAFEKEKELKKAGFAAKGISLLEAEIKEAEGKIDKMPASE